MATKSTKPSKTAKQKVYSASDRAIVPEIITRDPDVKYTGGEPVFITQPDSDRRELALIVAFNWYNRYHSRKMAKEQLGNYADYVGRNDLAKQLRRVEDREVIVTLGWLARLHMRGLNLSEKEQFTLDNEINRLVQTLTKPEVVEKAAAAEEKVSARPNIQEIMKERAREAAGELEGLLDEYVSAGAKGTPDVNAVGVLTERNIMPQHISILTDVWKKKRDEFDEVLAGKDKQLVEAYSHFSKSQIKSMVKFCESVLAGLGSYVSVKQVQKAPRKRKAISPEKQAIKVKYLKLFEELKLVSIHPSKIIGATELWAYDTAKRKLWYLIADSHVGTLGVKGTSILGFDSTKSGVKTVRKPADVLKKLMAAGRPAARKLFTEINSVHTVPSGRTNDDLIILKAY